MRTERILSCFKVIYLQDSWKENIADAQALAETGLKLTGEKLKLQALSVLRSSRGWRGEIALRTKNELRKAIE